VFVQSPDVGRVLTRGEECGVIESVKAAADIYSPLSGEVIAANPDLDAAPQKVNEDAYDAWLFKLRPSDPAELGQLLDAVAYEKIAEADKA
jgi:glycine cleavage system H protein